MSEDINTSLSVLFVKIYNDRKAEDKNYIPCGSVAKEIMIKMYDKFVAENLIEPIEKLPETEKKLLVEECRLTGEDFTNETLITTSKIFHVIKQINSYS